MKSPENPTVEKRELTEDNKVIGYRQIDAKWWRIVDGEPERELTEDEARDVGWGIWP